MLNKRLCEYTKKGLLNLIGSIKLRLNLNELGVIVIKYLYRGDIVSGGCDDGDNNEDADEVTCYELFLVWLC